MAPNVGMVPASVAGEGEVGAHVPTGAEPAVARGAGTPAPFAAVLHQQTDAAESSGARADQQAREVSARDRRRTRRASAAPFAAMATATAVPRASAARGTPAARGVADGATLDALAMAGDSLATVATGAATATATAGGDGAAARMDPPARRTGAGSPGPAQYGAGVGASGAAAPTSQVPPPVPDTASAVASVSATAAKAATAMRTAMRTAAAALRAGAAPAASVTVAAPAAATGASAAASPTAVAAGSPAQGAADRAGSAGGPRDDPRAIGATGAAGSGTVDAGTMAPLPADGLQDDAKQAAPTPGAPAFGGLLLPNATQAGPATALPMASQAATPQFAQELAQQVTTLAQNGGAQLTLQVNPPQLGRIQVSVTSQNNVIQVALVAQTAQAAQALQQSLPQLQSAFAQQGLNLGQANVAQQGFQGRQSRGGEPQPRAPRAAPVVGAAGGPTAVTHANARLAATHSGRVDAFA